jgi:FtsH-binding integral membrane protein
MAKTDRFLALLQSKKTFLAYVFLNLFFQLALAYTVMESFSKKKDKWSQFEFFGILFAQIAVLLVMIFVPMPPICKFGLFSVFSFLTGYLLSVVEDKTDPKVVRASMVGALSIFAGMFLCGAALIAVGVRLGFWFGLFLFTALMMLIIFQILSHFLGTHSVTSKATAAAGLFIFSLYMAYDTNTILQRNYNGDVITASMDYFLDIINVFLDLVILGEH